MISAMLFAGGSGTRMGASADVPKQFLEIEGKSIIIRTMEHFENHPLVDKIVVACKADWIDELKKQIKHFGITKVEDIVPGGANGFESIHNGVVRVAEYSKDDDIILICDGVRPMLSEELIDNCIKYTKKYETAVPVTPSIDSLLYSEDGDTCNKSYKRSSMYITQAPQGYTMKKILWAHEEAEKRGILNPVSSSELMIELGESVHLYQGERNNIKVTTPEDMHTLRSYFYYERYRTFAKEVMKYGF
ncbi:2-C-methyl-D-erythritol 4-phosphate cytidylyltransferase [Eubacterium oxidoreducens]|uniref:2-C-methyl-D-erythritol 4-phosphate cytidylyltransferase n=2 Tax=Eubacterium oxidoreducens TaxID=1732 RepID=A0A1G6CNK8_EUBOX|nr:2-C-methyl-D-erythritol 4-phosphate cytidylyltransferase [Eubacterium oxidoreducens]